MTAVAGAGRTTNWLYYCCPTEILVNGVLETAECAGPPSWGCQIRTVGGSSSSSSSCPAIFRPICYIFGLNFDKKRGPPSLIGLIAYGIVCGLVTAAAIGATANHVRVPGLWLITWVSYSVAAVAAAGVAVLLNANTISEFLNGMAFNAVVHVFCGAIYIYQRHQRGGQPQIIYQPPTTIAAGSVHTIQSASLTCSEKISVYTVGWCIKKVEFVIWLLSNVGIDLSAFFFPSPFYNFWQAKLMVRHFRFFQVHGVQLHADSADAYFLWLSEKMLNLITFTLYKRIRGDTYPKWLDSKLRWNGPPPAGFNNHFRIFHNNGTLCERLSYYLQVVVVHGLGLAMPVG